MSDFPGHGPQNGWAPKGSTLSPYVCTEIDAGKPTNTSRGSGDSGGITGWSKFIKPNEPLTRGKGPNMR
jgi:hypothetical protein